jgi:putative PEP-CTERM system TPR-repeat lipoprotein
MKRPRHNRSTVIAAALILSLTGCGKTPEQHFQQAQALLQKPDYKAAVIELKTVLQAQPDNREARLLLGEVYLKKEAYPDAESELSKARSAGVPDDQVIPLLAKAYVRMRDPQKALALGTPATVKSPRALALLYTARAEAQLYLGNRAEAEQSIRAAQQADPNELELLLTRAKLALMDKQNDQALALIEAALQRDAKSNEARYLKAAVLESENKLDDAVKAYQQILAADPSQFRADLGIAGLQMKKGDMPGADKAIQAAEKVAGKALMVRYARGALELQRGNLDKASSAFLDVLRVAPDHLPSMLSYAMASYGQGHYEQSIDYAGKVLGAVPDNLTAAKILAGSQLKTGDINGALNTLTPLLAKYPNDARLMALAGDANLQAKNYSQAMSYLDKAAELEPKNAAIKASQARGHLAMGDSNEALADLEQATSLSDKAGQADLALVMIHLNRKEYDQALQAISALEKKLPSNPVTYNLRAAALLGKQDRAGARKALERALAIQPNFMPAAVNLARLDIAENNPDSARKRFETILDKDKNNVPAMLALADLAAAQKQESEYVNWLEKASKAQPSALTPKQGLIQYYLGKKDNRKALAVAKEAVAANQDNPEAINLLGATQVGTGDLRGAIDTFTRLTEKLKNSPDAYLHLAMAQAADKQTGAARASLEQALRIKPDHIPSEDALMRLELADKNPDGALRIARQIQTQQPKSPLGYDREGDILVSQRSYPRAIRAYEQAFAMGPGTLSLIKLHRALTLAGDAKSADQRLADWIKQHPQDLVARNYSAELYMLTKRNRDAIIQYEALLKANPNNVVALNNLANLYQREKDGRALVMAEQAIKLAPESPSVQDTLGWILVEQGQLQRGLDLLGRAAGKVPKAGVIHYHYGVALAHSGRKAEARKELEAALASDQKFPEREEAKLLLKSL